MTLAHTRTNCTEVDVEQTSSLWALCIYGYALVGALVSVLRMTPCVVVLEAN